MMVSYRRALVLLSLAVCVLGASGARAQDTQYWTLQYGTRGELLGGVVVGSAVDLSATFYNPGSLALVKDPSSILTATVLGIQTIRISDVDPDQDVVASQNIGPEPAMFAGLLPLKWYSGRMAYSFLTRQKFDTHLVLREGAIIALDEPGDSLSLGNEVLFDQDVTENWGGLTWSRRGSEAIGVGVTLYGVYRSQTTSRRQTLEAIGGAGYGASLRVWNDIDFYTFRMLAKVGVEADFGGASLGLAFTTPSLPVLGNGDILINHTVVGDIDLDGTLDSAADVSFGEQVDAEYRSPMSVAVGGSYRWTTTTLHATVEYFAPVDEYTVMETTTPPGGPGVTTFPSHYDHALDEVVNFGAGLERRFSEKTTAYVSFIADRTAYRKVDGQPIVASTWDIYHLNGGVAFSIRGTDLTLGGGYAWGSRPLDIVPVSEGALPAGIVPDDVTYSRLKLILGFAL
jgi:hypothetical protein